MNLLLLDEGDFIDHQRARVTDSRRLQHLLKVQRVKVGDSLKAGRLGALMGQAKVLSLSKQQAELQLTLDQPPPPKLPLTLVLALPRPQMLHRLFQVIAAMGVPRLILLGSARVEKSFWQSRRLASDATRHELLLGLEQARDTVPPQIQIERQFKPFVEDRLPAIAGDSLGLLCHPGDYPPCPRSVSGAVTLAIGPEGGWLPYEVELLEKAGLQTVQLGARILRVETAVTALLGRLF
ncbi:16S rRNA methyltransferase [Ventosimonas gracilis]|uniref:Ribosomal RNA small subunit methyltransferase E n=1 Tax=Ventosimonas gracilis TaxID=1680762 RepID=A0A139SWJ6_9GAMM|nr:16S rRNA (uracil(1498)-N(3))-methyltransferase [Ventosimonas gracilis]KXU38973.1 16S rRNA methyltransferase [Ventosimonas gracilis]